MPSHPNAALLNEAHHPFPELLIPQGGPGDAEISDGTVDKRGGREAQTI
ncbi:hypothetical protein HF669_01535 [Acidithiobacillus thiooxidans]|jgi:hypothetical protein|uniref:Uncharacterized protein n=1 Tax=Acidithiobacillus montserratensis TaxID=2729135 RepID=A0ACD5HCY4_9PROT|nr:MULTISPECIES: hypothetical protein [Acidithiobacillus]MBU2748845.1 hypothetical protein [Acidithiobacillus montserratensis]MBU2792610.1 hypothetical protein [Acidithiobacillus thiooxidans]MBU2810088.1 hypothetical protein [Acidithiobacillus thiooxidans]MBU2836677.1 hypothetical protein [Acidithiobacillus thiooxidans]